MLIRNKEIAWKDEASHKRASSKTMFTGSMAKEFSAHHVRIASGGEIVAHSHERESELHFVISGQGQALVNGEWTSLGEGDVVLARPGVTHGLRNNGATTFHVLCIFSPPLE